MFPAGQYLFQAPNQYIFHGAEVYTDFEDETSCDSDESDCSADGMEDNSETDEVSLAVDGATCLRDSIQQTEMNDPSSSEQNDYTS